MLAFRVALPVERRAALSLLYRSLPPDDCVSRVAMALALIEQGEMDPDGLFVASSSRVRGVLLTVLLPGACAIVYPPEAIDDDLATADSLIALALGWLRERGVRIAQSLSPAGDSARFAPLVRAGFSHLGAMRYLFHPLDDTGSAGSAAFRLVPSTRAGERFGRTLLASYAGSLDFPELAGHRSLEEILAGHRHPADHDPNRWWLIESAGIDAGVVLVGPMAETNEWELSYFGLVPAARARGLARAVLATILGMAREADVFRMLVAVDARNLPACRLYERIGFLFEEVRGVYLKVIE